MRLVTTIVGEMHNDLFYKCTMFQDLEDGIAAEIHAARDRIASMDEASIKALVHAATGKLPKKIPGEAFIKRGGNGNNSTELFATLGVPVRLVTVVGSNARWMIDEVAAAGVDASRILTVPAPTPVSTIIEDPATTRILVAPNLKQAMNFSSAPPDPSTFAGTSVAFFTPLAPKFAPVLDLLHAPGNEGVLKAVTVEAQAIPDLATLRAIAGRGVDLLFVNQHDALAITGEASLDGADAILSTMAKVRVVTMGAAGSVIRSAFHAPVHLPVFDVPVVDRTGAGDAFAAGVLLKCHEFTGQHGGVMRFLETAPAAEKERFLTRIGTFGTAVASLKVMNARTPTKVEVDAFLHARGIEP